VTEQLTVEATGETVGEAKWSALRELERAHPGIDKASVRFEVLSEGERGLLGVGYEPARVLATVPESALESLPAPGDESELASELRAVIERIVETLGVRCRIDVEETEEQLLASCTGADLGVLIGKHGQTIEAIQHLASAIASRSPAAEGKEILVDAGGYRARRRATLEALADRSAERARRTGTSVALDPMTPSERKIVHSRLADVDGIATRSEGSEPHRYVVVSLAAEPPVADSSPVEGAAEDQDEG
jgi:spoIIIJ-associated protein